MQSCLLGANLAGSMELSSTKKTEKEVVKMKNAIEFFPNLNSLLSANSTRQVNRAFKGLTRCLDSNYESSRRTEFTGTANYAEAEKLCRGGWFEKLEEFKMACAVKPANQLRRRVVTAPVGYVPHVPNAIQGRPDSMIKTIMQKEKSRVLEIAVNASVNSDYTAETITKYAAEIVKAVSAIEAGGIRVKLIACVINTLSARNGQFAQCFVTIKAPTEKINPARIYFPLVHPSMLRRIGLRWLETCPDVTSKRFQGGYGVAQRLNKLTLPPQLARARFVNLADVIKGDWDTKEILSRL